MLLRVTNVSDRRLQRRAELLSVTGALFVGAGAGLLFARWFQSYATHLLLTGLVAHGWGMLWRHRLESTDGVVRQKWEEPLYWACWIAMAGVLLYALAT